MSRRGNTALLLFQCAFTGFVMGKAMADITKLRVRLPKIRRPYVDPSWRRPTLHELGIPIFRRDDAIKVKGDPELPSAAYWPTRTVVMQSVRVCAEDPLQQYWDEIAE
ncbi:Hypothetical protein PHPALM_14679 [Phytophthora palmivora]|uniref:Uncharacterized protein n=1 Tax=Phytophthora palmivora TaxID=4796 RepID=A0A2P4XU23_9STRA|nr:Hypothetical protein PHPALM_14679 [Phytophthora palmivora]